MNVLFKSEVSCLENYQFTNDEFAMNKANRRGNEYLLCIKSTCDTDRLDRVRRTDVTVWEVVKSYFGLGKLAGCDLRLASIAAHLEKRDLTPLAKESAAYRTVHGIATRMLTYKKSGKIIPALWENLAIESRKVTINRCNENRFNSEEPTYHLNSSKDRFLFLTPLTKFGHLRAQVEILEDKKATSTYVGGWGYNYRPWYSTFSDAQAVDDVSLKKVFFRVIEATHQTFSFRDYRWEGNRHDLLTGAYGI